jgi:hypothetical protein
LPPPIDPLDLNVVVSEDERRSGSLSAGNIRLGVLLLHTRGYVVLKGAIPGWLVTELRSRFRQLYEEALRHYRAGTGDVATSGPSELANCVFWERGSRYRIFLD